MKRFGLPHAVCLLTFSLLVTTASAEDLGSPDSSVFAGNGERSKRDQPYASGQPSQDRSSMRLGNAFGVEIKGGGVWITSVDDHCIYTGDSNQGPLTRVAGNGVLGYEGDGGPADQASFNWPHEVRVDADGNLFIADTRNHAIRRVDGKTQIVTTLAGNGTAGFAGEGEAGSNAQFNQPHSVVLDGSGGLLIADTINHRLRRLDLNTGVVSTISGTGERKLPTEGADAASAPLFGPRSLAVDANSIWIVLREGNSIWRIDRKTNQLHRVAGTGKKGYSGDGGPPLEATFRGPKGLTIDTQQRVLVVDTENHAIRRIDLKQNRIETVMGGTRAKQTFQLKRPHGIAYSDALGFLVGDSENHRVLQGR
ncbi:MAG: hypothetical protein AB8B91_01565 [Rubripirellula sp.]